MTGSSTPTVVLVHGGFVDGSGWEGVYNILKKDGYNVSIVQNPTHLAGRRRRRHEARDLAGAGPARDPRRPLLRRRRHHRGRQRSEGRRASSTSPRSRRTRASRWSR